MSEIPEQKTEEIVQESDTTPEVVADSDVVDEESELDPASQIKSLRQKLKVCVEEKQKYLDGWQRERASVVNLRKRDEEAKQQFLRFAEEELITELIPVLDSFDMAKANKEGWEKVDKNWRMGIEYIYSQLLSILEKHHVKIINPLNEEYSPTVHEAVELIDVQEENRDNKIIEVLQKGYMLHEKNIRAPKVKVGSHKK